MPVPTIQHVLLPDGRNHPWKGADGIQDKRSYYRASGAGSGVWVPYGTGQIYFRGSATVVGPVAFTRFAPVADYVANGFGWFVTESDDELIWTDNLSAHLAIDWSIVLSHTNAGAQKVEVQIAPVSGVAGFESQVHSANLAQNIERSFSGRLVDSAAQNADFSLWVKAPAGDVVVSNARISMHRIF